MRAEGAVTVDLGTDWEPRVATGPRPSAWRRVIAVGAVLAAVLAGILGGSAAPRPALIPVVSIPTGITDTVTLVGDHVFVRARNATRLDVYSLPTGRHLWRLGWPESIDTLRVDATLGVLLVETFDITRLAGTVTALELGTGRVLWRSDGLVSVLGQEVDGAALLAPADPSRAGQVKLVDVRTGAVRWSRATAQSTALGDDGPGRFLLRSPAGDAQVVELRTGRVLTSGLLGAPDPAAATKLDPDPVPWVSIVEGQVFLVYGADNASVIAAYDGTTFKERWRATEDGRVYWVAGCGPVLCVGGEGGVVGVDPATGARRWGPTAWSGAYPIGDGSRALMVGATGEWASALVDTATGAVRVPMRGWAPAESATAADPSLLTVSEVGRLGVWIGVLDAVRARVSPVSWLSGIANQCQQAAADPGYTYLACQTTTGGTEVWRYRSV